MERENLLQYFANSPIQQWLHFQTKGWDTFFVPMASWSPALILIFPQDQSLNSGVQTSSELEMTNNTREFTEVSVLSTLKCWKASFTFWDILTTDIYSPFPFQCTFSLDIQAGKLSLALRQAATRTNSVLCTRCTLLPPLLLRLHLLGCYQANNNADNRWSRDKPKKWSSVAAAIKTI